MVYIGTVRYNDETWKELQSYLDKNDKTNCIYNVPIRIAETIPIKSILIIFELRLARKSLRIYWNSVFETTFYGHFQVFSRFGFQGCFGGRFWKQKTPKKSSILEPRFHIFGVKFMTYF